MNRSVIVIGAGIGGLSAGCFARINGIGTKVFEMGTGPGGLCTAWKRNGYVFDGSIHHLAGTEEGSAPNDLWKALGAFPADVVYSDELVTIKDAEGRSLRVFFDADLLTQELKRIAPEDGQMIDAYVDFSREFEHLDFTEMGFWKWSDWPSRLVKMIRVVKRGGASMSEYAKRFHNPVLRRFFPTFQYNWTDIPVIAHLVIFAGCRQKRYGWYPGGSLAFSSAIARRLTALGGEIHYRSEVEKILVKGGRAVGVRLKSGESHYADAVISNATEYATMVKFLDGQYMDETQKAWFDHPVDAMRMGLNLSFGVNRDLSAEPPSLTLFAERPFEIAGVWRDCVTVQNHSFDPSMAPKGKSSLKVHYDTHYSYWEQLANHPERYREEKERIASTTLDQLEAFYPGIRGETEAIDVATPLTTERFTGNGRGYGDPSVMNSKQMLRSMLHKPLAVSGLRSCYLIGQSVGGAGILGCASMGRNAVKALCKERGWKYQR